MIFPSLQSAAIAFAVGAALSVPLTWYTVAEYKDAKHTAVIERQKSESATVLQRETEKVIAAERKTAKFKDELELQHAQNLEQVNSILADNKRLAARLGGLRDPGRRPGCGNPMPATAKPASGDSAPAAEGGLPDAGEGLLSEEAGRFILDLAADADRAAVYAITCHEWAMNVVKPK
jgi:hypothetical protein